MELVRYIKKEFESFKTSEIVFFFLIIFFIILVSLYFNDTKIALISAVCGISYTVFAGYGKIYCYFIGIIGTFCYCYLAYKNAFFGNLCLYGLYYLPMEIIGIFQWKKNLKKEKNEIIKTKLNSKQRAVYLIAGIITSLLCSTVLITLGDKKPFIDGFTTVFSIIGQYLTVKRCVEQWYVWFFVNLFSLLMWLFAVLNGAKCSATVLMWGIYLILSVYFLKRWNKELS